MHRQALLSVLKGLTSSEVSPDEVRQYALVELINPQLGQAGASLQEIDTADGYPRFAITTSGSGLRRPKNVIFASLTKPDLRLRSAVDNDVEVVTGESAVLIYTQHIGPGGLNRADLQDWWSTENGQDRDAAKGALYVRLKASLPEEPPQRNFFRAYHQACGRQMPQLPALLPEVWFHWDAKTARERGPDALLRFRMDFLLLMPMGRRVVVEVDGQHHYANDRRASPSRYQKWSRPTEISSCRATRSIPSSGERGVGRRCVSDFVWRLLPRHGLVLLFRDKESRDVPTAPLAARQLRGALTGRMRFRHFRCGPTCTCTPAPASRRCVSRARRCRPSRDMAGPSWPGSSVGVRAPGAATPRRTSHAGQADLEMGSLLEGRRLRA